MKFCKQYEEYMKSQNQKKKIPPGVAFKYFKKLLRNCRKDLPSQNHDSSDCVQHCPVCDETFFPSLQKEISAIVEFFNESAEKLLKEHLASGFHKCLIWLREKQKRDHVNLVQQGKDLVSYAVINAVAVRKILKKYDKVHYCCKQAEAFKSQVQTMRLEILQSPWLSELMAFHINMNKSNAKASTNNNASTLLDGSSLIIEDGKPSLSCQLSDSIKLDIDLTCSVCLDTLFDAVSLTCGHIFCYMCACKTASVNIVDGLKSAKPKEKCPLCREAGVYKGAVHMEEVNILLSQRCQDYWKERLRSERVERTRLVKEHWDRQYRMFMGV